jgi:hypothetical protein
MLPQPSPADTLRAYLSLAAPPVVPASLVKKRQIQYLKSPLYISDFHKIAPFGKSTIGFAQAVDPDNPQKSYFVCGLCDSKRLYTHLSSLDQHRKKRCLKHVDEPETQEEELDSLLKEAERYLDSLSLEDLQNQVQGVDAPATVETMSKSELIETFLSRLTQVKAPPADVPPVTSEAAQVMSGRAKRILDILPSLPKHLLVAAVLADTLPVKPLTVSIGIQTTEKLQYDDDSSDTNSDDEKRPLSPPPAGVRRSARLESLYRPFS